MGDSLGHDPVKRRIATAARTRRYRARLKSRRQAAQEAAAHLAAVAETAARRAAGIAKSERFRARAAARKAALDVLVKDSWFAPELTPSELETVAAVNSDPYLTQQRVAQFKGRATYHGLNLNRALIKQQGTPILERRAVFHILVEQGVPMAFAARRSETQRFAPVGDNAMQRDIYRKDSFAAAQMAWTGRESGIVAALADELKKQQKQALNGQRSGNGETNE